MKNKKPAGLSGLVGLSLVAFAVGGYGEAMGADLGKTLSGHHGVPGGVCVVVGCTDAELPLSLARHGGLVIRALFQDESDLRRARQAICGAGVYGRVSAACCDLKQLPCVDNLANLIVVENYRQLAPGGLSLDEIRRALAPLGVAYLGGEAANDGTEPKWVAGLSELDQGENTWLKIVKPWPKEIDEWRQYLHDADNNAVAHDAVVGPPRHLQWVTDPAWSRSHMAIATVVSMVSSKGRLFSIEDTATTENPFLPSRFSLIARDAFNGVVLWTHDFPDWEPVTRYIKDMAVQLQRRLAAIGDVTYCTPGLNAPLTAFDAATGKIIKVYHRTERTQEFAYDRGTLYLVVGDRMNSARYNIVKAYGGKGISLGGSDANAPFDGTGFRGAYAPETPDVADPTCAIVAIEAESGRQLWKKEDVHGYVGCTLAIRGQYAVYQTTGGLTCLDRTTGDGIWGVDKQIQSGDGTEANTLVLSDSAVYAKEGATLVVYSLEDGTQQWTAPIANNYEKSADLFLADAAVWTGGSGKPTSRDPKTGEQITVITQRMTGPMGHDRCYRNFITDHYYINSKTGGADFLSLDGKREFPNYWLRGTCGMGVLPCNGLLYVPPYSCQCSAGAMIQNFNAVYTEKGLAVSDQEIRVERKARLVKGPAYAKGSQRSSQDADDDWVTYRGDNARSGYTNNSLPAHLDQAWKTDLGGKLSAVTASGGRVFVAKVDAHTLYALDASDGSVLWKYVAGGRVDSPPTCYEGLVLFGARDGWVHCLRASDGALAWRFKDLPERMICGFGQLESAWPVCGSVLLRDDVAYFAAGRSSFLDGGIFVYGLDPRTGKVIHTRQLYGPFDKETGFPSTGAGALKSDIFVSDGELLYLRHRAFNADLTDADSPRAHLIASAGFLDDTPQHRTYWTIGTRYGWTSMGNRPSGDILVMRDGDFYEVQGFPVTRHSYFDPRIKGYQLRAGKLAAGNPSSTAGQKGKQDRRRTATADPSGKWSTDMPLTGKAMLLASEVLFVAGTPIQFPPHEPAAKYEAAYAGRLGGVLWAVSAADGGKLAEYRLDAAPAWDGMAAAENRLLMTMADGSIICLSAPQGKK